MAAAAAARVRPPQPPPRAELSLCEGGLAVRLDASWPPSANNLYAVVGRRKVLTQAGRLYHRAVLAAALAAGCPKVPPGRRLMAELDVHPPDNRRRDVLNLEKVLTDSLVAACVLADDCLIDRWVVTRRGNALGGRVVLRLGPWAGEGG